MSSPAAVTFHDSAVPWHSDSASGLLEAKDNTHFRAQRAVVWDAQGGWGRREDDADG